MNVEKVVVGDLETNCYLLTINNDCLVIDPGDDFEVIKKSIGNRHVIGCLVTHFHADHIGALEELTSYYNIDINKEENGPFKYKIIETPGHTFDSKTFYFPKDKIMFCGDFIFKSSIGRTDLGGSDSDMINSLESFKNYDDDITLYPGHGPSTTLGVEKNNFKYYY